ncbi:MAG: hypothetical protein M1812_006352 [Candelaria pacifica]|nr:MAG: hypothetical protein M1812_006352 [Candelaria pacifica]
MGYNTLFARGFCFGALAVILLYIAPSYFLRRIRRFKPSPEPMDAPQQSQTDVVKTTDDHLAVEGSYSNDAEGRDPDVEQTLGIGESLSIQSILPYFADNLLRLQVVSSSSTELILPSLIDVKIIQLIEPVTISPVMKVVLRDASGGEKTAILKLYDRRLSPGYRVDYMQKFDPWDLQREGEYRTAVARGQAAAYIQWMDDDQPEDDSDDFDDRMGSEIAQDESDVHRHCMLTHAHELAVYERLQKLQGHDIPKLFANVRLHRSSLDPSAPTGDTAKYFEIPGLLMEYIDGFPMSEIDAYAPSESWQAVIDDGLEIVNHLTDHGVLNRDTKPRNILVRKADNEAGYKAIMIDFGLGSIRDPSKPDGDLQWRYDKWSEDEQGAIGVVMEGTLKKIKPGVVKFVEKYGPSNQRFLGLHTFETPQSYQEWLLEEPDCVLESYHMAMLKLLQQRGALIVPIEKFGE